MVVGGLLHPLPAISSCDVPGFEWLVFCRQRGLSECTHWRRGGGCGRGGCGWGGRGKGGLQRGRGVDVFRSGKEDVGLDVDEVGTPSPHVLSIVNDGNHGIATWKYRPRRSSENGTPKINVTGFENRAHLELKLDVWLGKLRYSSVSKLPIALCFMSVAASISQICVFKM